MSGLRARPRIKFCGLTRPEDVRLAVDLGVDLIGFNLAKGPRCIPLDHAAALAVLVPAGITIVALFVDAADEVILSACARLRGAVAQLHGQEPADQAARLRQRVAVIKAFAVRQDADLAAVRAYPCDLALLDAMVGDGGSGHTWDYAVAADLGRPVMLAGGLTAERVASAIAAVQPYAVDVSSGIEAGTPGVKDPNRMRAFVAAVRGPA